MHFLQQLLKKNDKSSFNLIELKWFINEITYMYLFRMDSEDQFDHAGIINFLKFYRRLRLQPLVPTHSIWNNLEYNTFLRF